MKKCGFVRTGDETVVNENMTLGDCVKSCIKVRRFNEEDAKEVRNLIVGISWRLTVKIMACQQWKNLQRFTMWKRF